MNYTKPHEKNYDDKPEDWLYCMLAFGQAVTEAIPENYGVVIEPVGDMLEVKPEVKKMIVCKFDGMVRIIECDGRDDIKHGDWIEILKEDVISN